MPQKWNPFKANMAIPIPRHSRQIETLVDGSDLRAISDLIPARAVTDSMPLRGMAFQDIDWTNSPDPDPFATYILYKIATDLRHPEFVRLWFCQDRTATQLKTPVVTYETQRLITWDTILKWIQFFKATSTNQFKHRYGVIPAQQIMTNCTVRDYVSTVPWPQSALQTTKPFPTEVSWFYDGTQGSFPRCLHKKLTFPGYDRSLYQVFITGDAIQGSNLSSQVFPATNFVTWSDYFDEDTVTLQDNLYFRKSVELHAPALPRQIVEY